MENLGCPELIAAFEENRQKEIREKEQDEDKDKKKVKDKEKDGDSEPGKDAVSSAVSILHFYLLNQLGNDQNLTNFIQKFLSIEI